MGEHPFKAWEKRRKEHEHVLRARELERAVHGRRRSQRPPREEQEVVLAAQTLFVRRVQSLHKPIPQSWG
jgi:hypothetical protein